MLRGRNAADKKINENPKQFKCRMWLENSSSWLDRTMHDDDACGGTIDEWRDKTLFFGFDNGLEDIFLFFL